MKKKLVGFILSVLLIGISGLMAYKGLLDYKNAESKVFLDYAATYGISENQYTVVVNNVLQDYHAVSMSENIYLNLKSVRKEMNSRFYWDHNEGMLLYTRPMGNVTVMPESTSYIDPIDGEKTLDYTILKVVDEEYYIALDFVKMFTNCGIDVYTEPNRVVIRTDYSDASMITAKNDTYVRYRGGVKSEVLRACEEGEQFFVLDDSYDDWTCVATKDGYIGWVMNKYMTDVQTVAMADQQPVNNTDVYETVQRDHKIKMVWHQLMSETANANLDYDTASVTGVNVISPTWFSFKNTDGDIRSIASSSYVNKAHNKGMEVWALFSNEFMNEEGTLLFDGVQTDEVLSYTSKRQNAVNQIIKACLDAGVDGLNLDFERILSPSEESSAVNNPAANYIQFIRELGVACHKNNIIFSVDNYVPLYTQHYDRREQNVFADYLVIMGYDEYYAGGAQAGPVASIGFVEQGIKDTLAYDVSANKIINGIPFYTSIWHTDESGLKYESAGMNDVAEYAASHNAKPEWQEDLGVKYITYEGSDGNTYEMWYEDVDAVDRKMQLISEYDLAGVSCWKLGQQNNDVWSVISQYLP